MEQVVSSWRSKRLLSIYFGAWKADYHIEVPIFRLNETDRRLKLKLFGLLQDRIRRRNVSKVILSYANVFRRLICFRKWLIAFERFANVNKKRIELRTKYDNISSTRVLLVKTLTKFYQKVQCDALARNELTLISMNRSKYMKKRAFGSFVKYHKSSCSYHQKYINASLLYYSTLFYKILSKLRDNMLKRKLFQYKWKRSITHFTESAQRRGFAKLYNSINAKRAQKHVNILLTNRFKVGIRRKALVSLIRYCNYWCVC